jgi:hypothetical protein
VVLSVLAVVCYSVLSPLYAQTLDCLSHLTESSPSLNRLWEYHLSAEGVVKSLRHFHVADPIDAFRAGIESELLRQQAGVLVATSVADMGIEFDSVAWTHSGMLVKSPSCLGDTGRDVEFSMEKTHEASKVELVRQQHTLGASKTARNLFPLPSPMARS